MTREEAIQYLQKLYLMADITDEYGDMDDTTPYETAVDMAIEALKFCEVYNKTIEAVNKFYDDHHAQIVNWTPCSERLPEEKQVVLISNGKGHVRCGQYRGLAFRDSNPTQWWWKNKTIETVMAWMPLPEPYKGDKE